MFDPKLKDPFILNNYVGIKKITIVIIKCDSEIPIPFYVHFIKTFIILQNTHCHNPNLGAHDQNKGLQRCKPIVKLDSRISCSWECKKV